MIKAYSALLLLLFTLNLNAKAFEHLTPDEAFKAFAIEKEDHIATKIVLGEGIHLYQDSLHYKLVHPKEVELEVDLPPATEYEGDKVYSEDLEVDILLSRIREITKEDYTLQIAFQGCSENNLCYNPIEKEFSFKAQELGFFDKMMNLTTASNATLIVDTLKEESSIFVVLLFLMFGLLLSLTPCIFPMIPILSSILVSHNSHGVAPSAIRGFFISLVYLFSMAITYTIVGVISGLLGADIQAAMQNPWVLVGFAMMFVALAFSLFGYYQIQLPSRWQSKITSASDEAQHKGLLGVMVMGFLSAFVIGPCVAPPLAGAVLFISQTGDAILGGVALFAMSMGMGAPLLLLGMGAGKLLPRAGGWMDRVSQLFGVIMLALAIFMLSKVLSEGLTLLLWSLFFLGLSLFMEVFSNPRRGIQFMGLLSLIYGAVLMVGFISGAGSMLDPFEKFTSTTSLQAKPLSTVPKQGYSLAKLHAKIAQSDKPVMVEFSKKSCSACRELELLTFSDPEVKRELEAFTVITVDITDQTPEDKAMLKAYKLFGTPNMIFFDRNGEFLDHKSLTGFIDAKRFLSHLKTL